MQISMKTDIKAATKKLKGAQKKQVPFAISKALNDTAWDVAKEESRQLPMKLDRPTPFTLKAFGVKKSTKRNLVAIVFIKPIQAAYLRFQIDGGTRRPRGRALPIPVNQKLNKYGNIPKGKIKQLMGKPNTFSGVVKGVGGIWERGHHTNSGAFTSKGRSRSTSLRLLVAWEPDATYRSGRFPFFKIAAGKSKAVIAKNMRRALDYALRSAK